VCPNGKPPNANLTCPDSSGTCDGGQKGVCWGGKCANGGFPPCIASSSGTGIGIGIGTGGSATANGGTVIITNGGGGGGGNGGEGTGGGKPGGGASATAKSTGTSKSTSPAQAGSAISSKPTEGLYSSAFALLVCLGIGMGMALMV
jgi:hypothetical protein